MHCHRNLELNALSPERPEPLTESLEPRNRSITFEWHKREIGRSDRIRTYDPLVPNEVRYQTALHSDNAALIGGRLV